MTRQDVAQSDKPGKRLVICMDGTWNTKDSNTNIFHLRNLIRDKDAEGNRQLVYYDQGVGTGVLDRMTGGGFGFGLNTNVREAYEWLIENYADDDQIYIFGFSRGAYTARSLGGLIMKLGLVFPGAPLTITQLWKAYTILGRWQDDEHGGKAALNWWERLFGRKERPCRSLIELKWDNGQVKVQDANRTERLLLQWSRRVSIHCMGLFDTVGAMGWDALAIPGLRTRIAHFHNTNLTTLIRHGFHALAIDEHRANFSHVPWQRYLPKDPAQLEKARERAGRQTIEQRWFVGAHSNIGGGYEDNPLSLFSLSWMQERAASAGLSFIRMVERPKVADCVPLLKVDSALKEDKLKKKPYLRDSFSEFSFLHRTKLFRRFYRPIQPEPVDYGTHTLEAVNETLDESVQDFWKSDRDYRPKNLSAYFSRGGQAVQSNAFHPHGS